MISKSTNPAALGTRTGLGNSSCLEADDPRNISSPPKDQERAASNIDALTDQLSQDALVDIGNLFASLGISIAEAAYRGSSGLCRLHLIEVRSALKTAAQVLQIWQASAAGNGADWMEVRS